MTASTPVAAPVYDTVAEVTDPEMPFLTLADLGILRDVTVDSGGSVRVTITPTYSGCPAMATIRDDIRYALKRQGFTFVDVLTRLEPSWSSDWITATGRRKLAAAGYSPPGPAPERVAGPIPLTLSPRPRSVSCPQCGSRRSTLRSEFGATLCKAQYSCDDCGEPFDHVKEI